MKEFLALDIETPVMEFVTSIWIIFSRVPYSSWIALLFFWLYALGIIWIIQITFRRKQSQNDVNIEWGN